MKEKNESKYVAFCDILGFSSAVLAEFEKTKEVYKQFQVEVGKRKDLSDVQFSIYSDSILIVGDSLILVAQTVQLLLSTTLRYGWLVRGGIGYGKHWQESDEKNLFVVSEALVKAVRIEKAIKHPVIGVDADIELGFEYWMYGFVHSVFDMPIIHYGGLNIINPLNNYWFKSAEINLKNLKSQHSDHGEKYTYLLNLIDAVNAKQSFVPPEMITEAFERGLIEHL